MARNFKEILAPVGGTQALYAAVRSGADAVYLGGRAFNARRNAANFSADELKAAVEYCHARNVRVYITLNTLVGDGELTAACREIECACSLSADALILQDIGLAALARRLAPNMPLHASTQMSVQSADGVRLLEGEGFSRVVLARELSKEEIAKIAAETKAELEVFVHGALCMSVSGQCLLSAMLGSRSGNRGLCAQPCRLPFGVNGSDGHALSLKDLSIVERLGELADIGVSSFKIEGRMKRPEYVAAAVTACRQSLGGSCSSELSEQLRAVFSRSGFTDGYYTGRLGAEMLGTRRKEDVAGAASVLKALEHLYDREPARIPVDFALTCVNNEPLSLSASALGKSVFVGSEKAPEPALHRALDENELKARISKCGGTQFFANKVFVELDGGLNAPAGEFNSLRRQALTQLASALSKQPPKQFKADSVCLAAHSAAQRPGIRLRFFNENQLPEGLDGISQVILPLTVGRKTLERVAAAGVEAAVELPRAFFSNSEGFARLLEKARENGATCAAASTLDGLSLALKSGMRVSAGFGMNVFNSSALEFLRQLGVSDALVSCELTLAQIARLGADIPRGVQVYGKIPLMLMRNCPVKSKLSCDKCKGRSHLTDRMGINFPVQCSFGCSELLNSRPIYLADRLNEIKGADYLLLRFTDESREECERIIDAYLNARPPEGEFTRGLYYRGVE